MPREAKIFNDFSGGFVNAGDVHHLKDDECVRLSNLYCDDRGIVRIVPGITNLNIFNEITDLKSLAKNKGLFIFASDYNVYGSNGNTIYYAILGEDASGNTYLIIVDENGNVMPVEPSSAIKGVSFGAKSPLGISPSFYYVDGELRVCDDNLNKNYIVKHIKTCELHGDIPSGWYIFKNELTTPGSVPGQNISGVATNNELYGRGYTGSTNTSLVIQTTERKLLDLGLYVEFHHYIVNDNLNKYVICGDIQSHTSGVVISTESIGNEVSWLNAQYYIFPQKGGINVSIDSSSIKAGGSIEPDEYQFAYSYIYDKGQESKLKVLYGSYKLEDPSHPDWPVKVKIYIHATGPFPKRVTGMALYARKYSDPDNLTLQVGDWIKVLDISLEHGILSTYGDYNSRGEWYIPYFDNNYIFARAGCEISAFSGENYRSATGYMDTSKPIQIDSWKTADTVGNIVYAGNVYYNKKRYNDSVFKSFPGRCDTFVEERRLDIFPNDGDDIIYIKAIADRLFVFKKRKLYIVNTSQGIEFLEEELEGYGVEDQSHVLNIPGGILWANNLGVYMYDGQRVLDLLKDIADQTRRKISLSYWQSFFVNKDIAMAYDDHNKRVLILSFGSSQVNGLMFSLNTFSWNYLSNFFSHNPSNTRTNFVTNKDGRAICVVSNGTNLGDITTSLPPGAAKSILLETGPIKNEYHNVKLTLYKIYINYKYTGSGNISVFLRMPDNTTPLIGSLSGGGNNYKVGEFPININYGMQKYYTIVLSKTDNNYFSGLEINSIIAVYRSMTMR